MPSAPPDQHPFASLIGLEFSRIEAGSSECYLDVREEHLNPHRVVHGAVLYALADTGMGGALYPMLGPDEICATSQLSIAYSAAVREGRVTCTTRVVQKGKRIATLEAAVENDGRIAATAMGTYSVFAKR